MKPIFSVVCVCLLFWIGVAGSNCSAADPYKNSSELEKAGNLWRKGQPISAKLLEYRTSVNGSCFPDPMGTSVLFGSITNYFLFQEIIFRPQVDARVFSNAVNRAITLVGPKRFFSDSIQAIKGRPELAKQDRFKILQQQSSVKHIVVDSLYISYSDMAPDVAKKVLDQIAADLRAGKAWDDVQSKFSKAYEYPYEEKFSDGTAVNYTRTKIGNLGDFVLPANRNPLLSYREDWMPKEHIKKLFAANAGDILILFDKEDLSRFPTLSEKETGERYVLYKIREMYHGLSEP